ncbi:hypothetical protein E8E13_010947 [Curvularia kusanoi]|uniref:Microbial-type PARG catalytic domain-containing protein n=1 Tax=Curvularia kusanoi TaxID=90978 RepID=A0A9P4TK14_CURKU|nr:hypothetical protein E8E13_010947 [Curvularia kusanoi]
MLDLAQRQIACEDTLTRTPGIAASAAAAGGQPLSSTFVRAQLAPLNKSSPGYPGFERGPVKVYNSDAFALARTLGPASTSTDAEAADTHTTRGTAGAARSAKVGVLNLASDQHPGGGWRYTLSKTQEEALCYSSTLFATLKPEWYPFPNTGPGSCAGIVSPNVVVFKDTLDNDLVDLPVEQRHVVTVITVAAPCGPRLTADGGDFADAGQLNDLKEKILLVLRAAAVNGVTKLVLGAMGCGAYGCPPRVVARLMREAIESEEFEGWFEDVVFAVYAAGPTGKENFEVFTEVFGGVDGAPGH